MPQKLFPLFKDVTGPVRAINAVILQQITTRHLNQRQFAEDAHISPSELTLIKGSHRFIRLNTVEHIAGALEMMPSGLLALTERMVQDAEDTFGNLPSGTKVNVTATARNQTGESQPCAAVAAVVP